jgi:hypothetical protein
VTQLRRLNDVGIARLLDFLHRVKDDPNLATPREILHHPSTSTDLGEVSIEIEQQIFPNRLSAAKYLFEAFDRSGLTQIEQDRGLWAWLALFYFDQLCPAGKKGQRKPFEDARWIPESGRAFRYYRHLLAGPYRIYRAHRDHPEKAMIILCGPLDSPGDLVEQLASRQELVTNAALLATASALYLDPQNGLPKRGVVTTERSSGRRRGKPGTVRRLIEVCSQYDVVWDLYAMAPQAVVEMLPKEFDRFRA